MPAIPIAGKRPSPEKIARMPVHALRCTSILLAAAARAHKGPDDERARSTVAGVEVAGSDEDACEPSTAVPHQFRTKMKHRAPSQLDHQAVVIMTDEMIAWDVPASAGDASDRLDEPIDAKETTVFGIVGDVRLAKIEANDCDVHLEISDPGGEERVIIEIPQGEEFVEARRAISRALRPWGH